MGVGGRDCRQGVLGGMQFGDYCAGATIFLGCCLGCWLRCSSGAGVQSLARVSLFGVYSGVFLFKIEAPASNLDGQLQKWVNSKKRFKTECSSPP